MTPWTLIDDLVDTCNPTGKDKGSDVKTPEQVAKRHRGSSAGRSRSSSRHVQGNELIQPSISFKKPETTNVNNQTSVTEVINRLNKLQLEYDQKLTNLEKSQLRLTGNNKQLREDITKLNSDNVSLKEQLTWCQDKIAETDQNASYAIYHSRLNFCKYNKCI